MAIDLEDTTLPGHLITCDRCDATLAVHSPETTRLVHYGDGSHTILHDLTYRDPEDPAEVVTLHGSHEIPQWDAAFGYRLRVPEARHHLLPLHPFPLTADV